MKMRLLKGWRGARRIGRAREWVVLGRASAGTGRTGDVTERDPIDVVLRRGTPSTRRAPRRPAQRVALVRVNAGIDSGRRVPIPSRDDGGPQAAHHQRVRLPARRTWRL